MSTRAGDTGTCPHCRTGVRFERVSLDGFGVVSQVIVRIPSQAWIELHLSGCPVCGKGVVELGRIGEATGGSNGGPGVIYPRGAGRPIAAEVSLAAPGLAADFAEAVAVLPTSRKASAALSRRCLQFVLTTAGGVKKRDLADQIGEVLRKLPPQIAENVDAIRHVGNFAAHPMKSTNSGEIVDVEDGEAEWLLDVLEELFDFYYVGPAKAAAKRDALNKKLADLGKPPLKGP